MKITVENNEVHIQFQLPPGTAMHPSSERFYALLGEAAELHARKQADYGKINDPFANVRGSQEFGIPGWVGAVLRGNDKVRRIQSFLQNGRLENEGLEDALKDLAVYALIALVLWREDQAAETLG